MRPSAAPQVRRHAVTAVRSSSLRILVLCIAVIACVAASFSWLTWRHLHEAIATEPASGAHIGAPRAEDSAASKKWAAYLRQTDWPWLKGYSGPAAGASSAELLNEASAFVVRPDADRDGLLKRYQRVLDLAPPQELDLKVRLDMGSAMVIGFQPHIDLVAIPWYAQLVEMIEAGGPALRGHRNAIAAKLHLADLLWRNAETKLLFAEKIDDLYEQILSIPADEVVFDADSEKSLNLPIAAGTSKPRLAATTQAGQPVGIDIEEATRAAIAAQKVPQLIAERKRRIDELRAIATQSYAYKHWDPSSPMANIDSLRKLKERRPDDAVYQRALDELIEGQQTLMKKLHHGNQ